MFFKAAVPPADCEMDFIKLQHLFNSYELDSQAGFKAGFYIRRYYGLHYVQVSVVLANDAPEKAIKGAGMSMRIVKIVHVITLIWSPARSGFIRNTTS